MKRYQKELTVRFHKGEIIEALEPDSTDSKKDSCDFCID